MLLKVRYLLACRGPLAAAADALGRVMLLDAASGAVLRILKGALHKSGIEKTQLETVG